MKIRYLSLGISSFLVIFVASYSAMKNIPTKVQYKEIGYSSWYGKTFHGKKTASGSKFDMYALTAAHKTLPFNTKVTVKNLENNKVVTVKVNDRGPYAKGRIIDLSYSAAKKLDMLEKGVVKVQITAQLASHD